MALDESNTVYQTPDSVTWRVMDLGTLRGLFRCLTWVPGAQLLLHNAVTNLVSASLSF